MFSCLILEFCGYILAKCLLRREEIALAPLGGGGGKARDEPKFEHVFFITFSFLFLSCSWQDLRYSDVQIKNSYNFLGF